MRRLRAVVGTALIVSPVFVCGTWYMAWLYARSHGAPRDDNIFAWEPLQVIFVAVPALCVAGLLGLLALTGRRTIAQLRALTAIGTAVVLVQLVLTNAVSLQDIGGPEGFPKAPGVVLALAVGIVASALPLAAAWWMLNRDSTIADPAPVAADAN